MTTVTRKHKQSISIGIGLTISLLGLAIFALTSIPRSFASFNACTIPNIDFETDGFGSALKPGKTPFTAWSSVGLYVSSRQPLTHPPMLFDMAAPGAHVSLGTPNEAFAGPGVGVGGGLGRPGVNSTNQGLGLIIAENRNGPQFGVHEGGGTLYFGFEQPTDVYAIQLLDIDYGEVGGYVRIFNNMGALITEQPILGYGTNSHQTVVVEALFASAMEVELVGGGAVTSLMFCNEGAPDLGRIGDRVWVDTNQNGIQNSGEPGLAGVLIELVDENGNVLGRTVTDSDGLYSFPNLGPGQYETRVVTTTLPDGYVQTFDLDTNLNNASGLVTISTGQVRDNLDFGYYIPNYMSQMTAIGNRVWFDINANGVQDAGEPGIPGMQVILTTRYADGTETVQMTTSGANGFYEFDNLQLDGTNDPTMTLSITLPEGFTASPSDASGNDCTDSDNPNGVTVNPVRGVSDVALRPNPADDAPNGCYDFGLTGSYCLGNFVWEDKNVDGLQDEGAAGAIAQVPMHLYIDVDGNSVISSADVQVGDTLTGSAGDYEFCGLIPAAYIVVIPESAFDRFGGGVLAPYGGVTLMTQNPNDDNDNDSNGARFPGVGVASEALLLVGNEPSNGGRTNNTLDFGFLPTPGQTAVSLSSSGTVNGLPLALTATVASLLVMLSAIVVFGRRRS